VLKLNIYQLKYKLKWYKQDPDTFSRQIAELEKEIDAAKWDKFDAECEEIMRGEGL